MHPQNSRRKTLLSSFTGLQKYYPDVIKTDIVRIKFHFLSFIEDKNMATIIRQSYIDKIERYLGKETIIVLVGQRRVGKSCMMKMIRDRKIADDGITHLHLRKFLTEGL